MNINNKTVCVFGGTGFIGTQVVRELAALGLTIKVATRFPESAYELRTCGVVGQVVPFACDYSEDGIAEAVKGCEFVINCIGILYEKRKNKFSRAHIDIPQNIAKACKREKVQRFVHVSALGVDEGSSKYAKTKLGGEEAVKKEFPDVTILRPSVVFGPEDDFFNMFACLAQVAPVLPLIGGGKTKFQPVYVGDVADAIIAALTLPIIGKDNPQGKIYELGGPEVLSFKEIYAQLFEVTKRKRILVSLPFSIAKIKGAFLSMLPKPLLTPDQVESLKHDSVVSENALTLENLGVQPTGLDAILPTYLARFRPGGRFGAKKSA